ncbi:MAG: TIGR04282 family arsenosugar biosynthesis glycosyltransferase [Candidatus Cyclobacteriaceae bacterium M2_1C_046]
MNDRLLIVFAKNPEMGRVKTRLAKDIGEEKALAVYFKLLNHTRNVALETDADVAIFYDQYVDTEDEWDNQLFQKYKQAGNDLGERMYNSLAKGKEKGYHKICLIGADIWGLNADIIDKAFEKLAYHDWVFGPAKDGGYYLVGCREPQKEVFDLEKWSHPLVLNETLKICNDLKLSVGLVDELNDIDTIEDLKGTDL